MAESFITRKGSIQKYEENMLQFFAIPSTTGSIRLKVQKPLNSTGVVIRYKTSEWLPTDKKENGTFVATITDDSLYYGNNNWYTVSGLTNSTLYFFKAFAYKGNSFNEVIGVNETKAKAGGLLSEYSFDSISGSTLYDTAGTLHGTMTNITVNSGKIGNKGVFNGSSSRVKVVPNYALSSIKSISCIIDTTSSAGGTILGWMHNQDYPCLDLSFDGTANIMYASQSNVRNGGGGKGISFASPDQINHFVIHYTQNLSTTTQDMMAYINGSAVSFTSTKSGAVADHSNGDSFMGAFYDTPPNLRGWYNGNLDQLRIWNRRLEDYEITNLYNGGLGC